MKHVLFYSQHYLAMKFSGSEIAPLKQKTSTNPVSSIYSNPDSGPARTRASCQCSWSGWTVSSGATCGSPSASLASTRLPAESAAGSCCQASPSVRARQAAATTWTCSMVRCNQDCSLQRCAVFSTDTEWVCRLTCAVMVWGCYPVQCTWRAFAPIP